MEVPITAIDNIKHLLPHREPIIMVDVLHHFDQNSAEAGLTIFSENIFVENDKLSETGLIEHMAQTAALYMGYQSFLNQTLPSEGYIASIKKLHIEKLPKVNDVLYTEITSLYTNNNMSMVKLETKLNKITIAVSEMNLVLKFLEG